MRPISRLTKPLFQPAVRMFSVFRAEVPRFITQRFNESSSPQLGSNKYFIDAKAVTSISAKLRHQLNEKITQGDDESLKFLTAIEGFKNNKAMALFLTNGPTEGRSLVHFSDVIADLSGFNCETDNRKEHRINPEDQSSTVLTPHTDGLHYGASKSPQMITLLGYQATKGNFRNTFINIKNVLDELSYDSIQILQDPIFFMTLGRRKESPYPIVYKIDNAFGVNFTSNQPYQFDLSNHSAAAKKDVRKALDEINNVTMRFYHDKDVESIYIKNGDSAYIMNRIPQAPGISCFHSRDQVGVPESDRDYVRIVLSNTYTKAEGKPATELSDNQGIKTEQLSLSGAKQRY